MEIVKYLMTSYETRQETNREAAEERGRGTQEKGRAAGAVPVLAIDYVQLTMQRGWY